MLQKKYRLKPVLLKNPKSYSLTSFNVKVAKNKEEVSHFAFIVSKRIDRRSTARNALKRKLRSCVEEIFDSIRSGNDFIFYPKQEAIKITREQFLEELNCFLTREKLLK